MPIQIGTKNISAIQIGDTKIVKIQIGDKVVWSGSKKLYLADAQGRDLYIIDPNKVTEGDVSQTLVGELPAQFIQPLGMTDYNNLLYAWDTSGDELFSINPNSVTEGVVSTTLRGMNTRIGTAPSLVNHNGTLLLFEQATGNVYTIDPASAATKLVNTLTQIYIQGSASDGEHIYAVDIAISGSRVNGYNLYRYSFTGGRLTGGTLIGRVVDGNNTPVNALAFLGDTLYATSSGSPTDSLYTLNPSDTFGSSPVRVRFTKVGDFKSPITVPLALASL